jgi:YD repeat-containing protein
MHECVVDQAGTEILRYQYDRAGQLTNRWSAAKGNTGYAFDWVGNLTNINYPASPDIVVRVKNSQAPPG